MSQFTLNPDFSTSKRSPDIQKLFACPLKSTSDLLPIKIIIIKYPASCNHEMSIRSRTSLILEFIRVTSTDWFQFLHDEKPRDSVDRNPNLPFTPICCTFFRFPKLCGKSRALTFTVPKIISWFYIFLLLRVFMQKIYEQLWCKYVISKSPQFSVRAYFGPIVWRWIGKNKENMQVAY